MTHALTRRAVGSGLAGGLVMLAASGPHAQVTSRDQPTQNPVTPRDIDLRLERHAAEIQKIAPHGADRNVMFDLAYPGDPEEYRAVGKTALILIIAVSKVADELPLRRVYTRSGGQDVDLQRLGSRRSDLGARSLARAVFGRFREDAFYLAPVGALLSENVLMCDFAKNRTGFVINRAPFEPPDYIRDDRARAAADKPQDAAVKTFVEREYRGFGIVGR